MATVNWAIGQMGKWTNGLLIYFVFNSKLSIPIKRKEQKKYKNGTKKAA
jgi:hypothetical protein